VTETRFGVNSEKSQVEDVEPLPEHREASTGPMPTIPEGRAVAQRYEGQRKLILCRPVEEVHQDVKARAAARGIRMSHLVADVLACRYDREGLVRELHKNPEVMPLAM
ncbi:hypothetical protein, partial [Mycobacterium paragordonae]|uniref:hypothetical protein n=1 Tax=Mycobacterium paragordonae TaxID=1389713 RepID=UPI003987CE3A